MTAPAESKAKPTKSTTPEKSFPGFKHYEVEIKMRDKLLGGIPWDSRFEMNFDVHAWVQEQVRKLREKITSQGAKEKGDKILIDPKLTDEELEKYVKVPPHTTFHISDEGKICLEEKNIKGLLKECVNTVYGRGRKSTLTGKLVVRGVFMKPPKIVLGDTVNGTLKGIDGTLRRPVHAITPMGPRTSLQDVDFMHKTTLKFTLLVAAAEINLELLKGLLMLGQEQGLGAVRSQGYGKYDLVSIKELPMVS